MLIKYARILICIYGIGIFSSQADEYNLPLTRIEICSPYDSAPFVIDPDTAKGIIYSFAQYLNLYSSEFRFEVSISPRSRLLTHLKAGASCVVPFVSEQWFDPDETQFYWSDNIITDGNIIASLSKHKLEDLEIETVRGLTTAKIIGQKNERIDYLISHKIVNAYHSETIETCLKMLQYQRVDFLNTGKSLLSYLIAQNHLQDTIYLSKHYTEKFDRRVLITKNIPPESAQKIINLAYAFRDSSYWKQEKIKFGLQ